MLEVLVVGVRVMVILIQGMVDENRFVVLLEFIFDPYRHLWSNC